MKAIRTALFATALFLAAGPAKSAETSGTDHPYQFLKEIPIGGDGGWDYLSVDAPGRRLFVSHGDRVVVVDVANDKASGELLGTPGVHLAVVGGERIFTSNGRDNSVGIFDAKSLKSIATTPTGAGPDAMLYEPGHQEVYTFNGRDRSATVIDAGTGKLVATIPLDGRPEFAVADPKAGRVYCNIEDKNELVAIDTATHKVVNSWPIAPGEGASGLAIDPTTGRLFLGCSNRMMLMMDGATGKVLSSVPIGKGTDAIAFDPESQLAFSSNGEGNVTVAHVSGDKMEVVQTLVTEPRARTMAIDPSTKRIYLASAKFEPVPPTQPGEHSRWPKVTPGSFKILVYGQKD